MERAPTSDYSVAQADCIDYNIPFHIEVDGYMDGTAMDQPVITQ
jgi:hypothetical protein